jgi:methionyl-tRNA formyltransferase
LNLVFAGTPAFAAQVLDALIQSRHRVQAVLTQPDRRSGRGLAFAASEVKSVAHTRGIATLQPVSLHDARVLAELAALSPDVMVVAAYGLILPQQVLDIPHRGAINVHASLLPRWRGAAPIQRALLAGDRETGISIMQMDAGLDTGPVLVRESMAIMEDDSAGTLHDRLAVLGSRLCVRALDAIEAGKITPAPQHEAEATYAKKIDKAEARIDWRDTAEAVCRRVRAFNPTPGARAGIKGVEVKIWRCAAAQGQGSPGQVLAAGERGLLIACGQRAILATELQRANGKRLPFADFLRGFPVSPGDRFVSDIAA